MIAVASINRQQHNCLITFTCLLISFEYDRAAAAEREVLVHGSQEGTEVREGQFASHHLDYAIHSDHVNIHRQHGSDTCEREVNLSTDLIAGGNGNENQSGSLSNGNGNIAEEKEGDDSSSYAMLAITDDLFPSLSPKLPLSQRSPWPPLSASSPILASPDSVTPRHFKQLVPVQTQAQAHTPRHTRAAVLQAGGKDTNKLDVKTKDVATERSPDFLRAFAAAEELRHHHQQQYFHYPQPHYCQQQQQLDKMYDPLAAAPTATFSTATITTSIGSLDACESAVATVESEATTFVVTTPQKVDLRRKFLIGRGVGGGYCGFHDRAEENGEGNGEVRHLLVDADDDDNNDITATAIEHREPQQRPTPNTAMVLELCDRIDRRLLTSRKDFLGSDEEDEKEAVGGGRGQGDDSASNEEADYEIGDVTGQFSDADTCSSDGGTPVALKEGQFRLPLSSLSSLSSTAAPPHAASNLPSSFMVAGGYGVIATQPTSPDDKMKVTLPALPAAQSSSLPLGNAVVGPVASSALPSSFSFPFPPFAFASSCRENLSSSFPPEASRLYWREEAHRSERRLGDLRRYLNVVQRSKVGRVFVLLVDMLNDWVVDKKESSSARRGLPAPFRVYGDDNERSTMSELSCVGMPATLIIMFLINYTFWIQKIFSPDRQTDRQTDIYLFIHCVEQRERGKQTRILFVIPSLRQNSLHSDITDQLTCQ
jgi:hypothetical protein